MAVCSLYCYFFLCFVYYDIRVESPQGGIISDIAFDPDTIHTMYNYKSGRKRLI